jgi:hypothetical protein
MAQDYVAVRFDDGPTEFVPVEDVKLENRPTVEQLKMQWLAVVNALEMKYEAPYRHRTKTHIVSELTCVSFDAETLRYVATYSHDKQFWSADLRRFLCKYESQS